MVTEDQLIVRRKRNVADRLGELREDFGVAASALRTGCARDDCRRQKSDKSNTSPHASHRSLPVFLRLFRRAFARSAPAAAAGFECRDLMRTEAVARSSPPRRYRSLREPRCALIWGLA